MLSVIISTYDRPDALRRVLEGYARSTYRRFEVVVADDGSGPETAAVVDDLARGAPFPLRRVWQPHEGFRLAAARNLAARAAAGDVLVLTDGDCIPFPDALEAHAELCARGRAVTGDRCLLDLEETERILGGLEAPESAFERARRREAPRLGRLRWKNRLYALTGWKPRPKLLAANASVHRQDFEAVNGFDERFVGWGYEDEDLARRLRRTGVRVIDRALESLVLHLFHPVHASHRPDARSGENYRYFKRGAFLTRPLRGLRPRTVEDLEVEWLGEGPLAAGAGLPGPRGRPELSLVRAGMRPRARPRGELVLEVPGSSLPFGSPEELYRFLRERI
ncbi:MAG: glycosyltransferase [Planctomycetes bacterium]|nr:glycosyltransferase [Planctomycetota bacterium]